MQSSLSSLNLDRWKRGSVREEATRDIGDILQDIQQNVPTLMQPADAAPASLSKVLPLSRHIDALYDVFLRVEEASRIVAPGEQVDRLQLALRNLSDARAALDKQVQAIAESQEKQVGEMHARILAQAAFKCPAPPPPPPCPKPKPRAIIRKRKPAATTTPQKQGTPPGASAQQSTQKTGK